MPIPADSVADSIGVSIHLHFHDTVYGDFPLVRRLLHELGVRHVRDGLIDTAWTPYYERHRLLGEDGIRCLYVTAPKLSSEAITGWPKRVGPAFEGYEAPNEYDNSHDPQWAATLQDFLPRLREAAHAAPEAASLPIIGPSLIHASDYAQIQAAGPTFDIGNLHNYFGGRNPGTAGWGNNGYGSIDANMRDIHAVWPGKPLMTTETGYTTDPAAPQGIPEDVEGRYMPRAILEQLLHGIQRTYLYELIDEGQAGVGERAFGLAHGDGSPKPAFTALANLIRETESSGGMPPLGNLDVRIEGGSASVHHMLLERRDGTYLLALWIEAPAYDVNSKQAIPVPSQRVVVHLGKTFPTTSLWALQPDGSALRHTLGASADVPLTVSDTLSMLELR